jgi:hypothetical protein
MIITKKSQLTGEEHSMNLDVSQDQMRRFHTRKETGEYVQTIFPNLNPEEREFLLTGITPDEWNDFVVDGEI